MAQVAYSGFWIPASMISKRVFGVLKTSVILIADYFSSLSLVASSILYWKTLSISLK